MKPQNENIDEIIFILKKETGLSENAFLAEAEEAVAECLFPGEEERVIQTGKQDFFKLSFLTSILGYILFIVSMFLYFI